MEASFLEVRKKLPLYRLISNGFIEVLDIVCGIFSLYSFQLFIFSKIQLHFYPMNPKNVKYFLCRKTSSQQARYAATGLI